jgi:ribonuclease-3
MQDLTQLCNHIGYCFKDLRLLKRALTHRSYGRQSYERLEFLGDAILNFIMAEELYRRYPRAKEGEMSRRRAFLVNGEKLFLLAQTLKINTYLLLGAGELKTGGAERQSILADAMEAIIGAIYLDAGMDVCKRCVLSWYNETDFNQARVVKDSKSELQEWLQSKSFPLPRYTLMHLSGKAHAQNFTVSCSVKGLDYVTEGVGTSRRKAEQEAAKNFLKLLLE